MNRRKALFIASVIASSSVAIVVSCTFPEVSSFAPEAIGNDGGGDTDGGPDPASDAGADVFVVVDAAAADTDGAIVKDAGAPPIDAATCLSANTNCDCDDDKFNRAGCDAGATPGPIDCDDSDQRTHPTQGHLDIKAEPPRNGDWNCANNVERYYTPSINCGAIAAGDTCDHTFGFEDDPPCGEVGSYVVCATQPGTLIPLKAAYCYVKSRALGTKQACK